MKDRYFKDEKGGKIIVKFFARDGWNFCYVYRWGMKGWCAKFREDRLPEYLAAGKFFEIGVTKVEKQRKAGQLDLFRV